MFTVICYQKAVTVTDNERPISLFDIQKPEEGSEEWKLLDACINPKEWI